MLGFCFDFNPRSPWGERPKFGKDKSDDFIISIHALREESDRGYIGIIGCIPDFNPRSPWGERLNDEIDKYVEQDFNPRSPWGERRNQRLNQTIKWLFQSTLSVRRATGCPVRIVTQSINFNPRSPWGERLKAWKFIDYNHIISIHALREESDLIITRQINSGQISIHALREESDLKLESSSTTTISFQSTLSVRRATSSSQGR